MYYLLLLFIIIYCLFKVSQIESFESSNTSHSVDLPINTKYSCQNNCGPQSKCSITG